MGFLFLQVSKNFPQRVDAENRAQRYYIKKDQCLNSSLLTRGNFPSFYLLHLFTKRLISLPALNKEDHVSRLTDLLSLSFLECFTNFSLSSLAFGLAREYLFFEPSP